MATKGNTILGVSLGTIAIAAIAIIIVRKQVKDKGWTHNKVASKLFKVPLVDKKYQDLQEQTENAETADGIEFRADGSQHSDAIGPRASGFAKLGDCYGLCQPPKVCMKGVCI